MKTTEELLENRHTTQLRFHEPWSGRSADGNPVTCHAEIRMTVHDCINLVRERYAKEAPELLPGLSDAELLHEFMVVHWAAEVESG